MIGYDWIVENRGLVKLIYGIIIILICEIIVFKANKLFKLSLHEGIRYFRNAFFFFGMAFFFRYVIGWLTFSEYIPLEYYILKDIFEFFLIMGGFFLLYSLLWKKFDIVKKHKSSLFNSKIAIFYLMTLILVIIDHIWYDYYLLFASQIILFMFTSAISYSNFIKSNRKNFLRLYFIAMFLGFIAWILNALASIYVGANNNVAIGIYLLNTIFFFLFLYGVIKVTREK